MCRTRRHGRSLPRIPAAAGLLMLALAPAATAQSRTFELAPAVDGARDWRAVDDGSPGPEDRTIAEARRALAADEPRLARRLLDDWIEENDVRGQPRLAEALLLRGDALVALDYEYRALYDYERVAKEFPESAEFVTAVKRELKIGLEYIGGLKRRVFGIRMADGTEIGVELLIRVQERMPGSELAEEASISLADHYYANQDLRLARDAYELYLENFPDGPNRLWAEGRLIDANVGRFKGPAYDGSGLLDARVRIRNFERRFPAAAERSGLNEGMIARIDESLAAQLLSTAEWYDTQDDPAAVRYTLQRLAREYDGTLSAARGMEILRDRGWLDDESEPEEDAQESAEPDEGAGAPGDDAS